MPKINARYVDTPSPAIRLGRGSFEKVLPVTDWQAHSEDAVNRKIIPLLVPLSWCHPDYGETFTESLILAQDER
ncbi:MULTISPECIES: hypothetical protein, partial [unclassified Streptomyces]|uniref:hypothetical protein n=1 Tax=unclassified Streptomyces TaxID=2593676 RepID=UPI001C654DA7